MISWTAEGLVRLQQIGNVKSVNYAAQKTNFAISLKLCPKIQIIWDMTKPWLGKVGALFHKKTKKGHVCYF